MTQPEVLIVIGSDSDLPVAQETFHILERFGVKYEARISSAHRSPERTSRIAAEAASKGVKIIIAGAGMAAHLAGVIASSTTLPVIGIPMPGGALNGVDALYSTVQMPGGIPVATMAIGKSGARNAAIFAIQILSLQNHKLAEMLQEYRHEIAKEVEMKDQELMSGINGQPVFP